MPHESFFDARLEASMDIENLIKRLEQLDCCNVSDAMDKLGVTGVADGIKRMATRQKIAGRVNTMRIGPGAAPAGTRSHLGSRSIEASGVLDIIVIEQATGIDAACWGGVLSEATHHKHIRGVVVDGPIRDVDGINETGLPVFAKTVTPRSARGRIHEAETDIEIRISGIDVFPGDLVIADGSGVAFIPAAIADRVITEAETIAAAEKKMIEAVHENRPVTEIMDMKYETLLDS